MRPGTPSYFFPQQPQQPQAALHLSPGYAPIPVQQISTGALYRPSFYGQSISNGLQQQYMGLPMGGASLSGAQPRAILLPQDAPLLQQPWDHISHEPQVWRSGGLPNSPQGLIQQHQPFIQHISQQQQVYLQDVGPASIGRNGGILPQFQGADRAPAFARQDFMQSNDARDQFGMGAAAMGQRSRMQSDEMQSAEAYRGNIYGTGQAIANGQAVSNGQSYIKPYENGNGSPGKWSRGGANQNSSNSRFRGGKAEKNRGGDSVRTKAVVLRCDPCARTFTNAQQSNAHFSTHAKCDADGCSFEASGRVLKEHRQMSHGISVEMPVRSKKSRSADSEEELIKWREERRVNYPTTANMIRKAEEAKAKRLRGELVDEDARKRRERLKEILAKQAELGVPVAEVPSYYMSDHSTHWKKTNIGRTDHSAAPQNGVERSSLKDDESSSMGVIETVAAAESSCTATPNSRKSARRSNDAANLGQDPTNSDFQEPEQKIARIMDASVDCQDGECVVDMEVDAGKDVQTTLLKEQDDTKNITQDETKRFSQDETKEIQTDNASNKGRTSVTRPSEKTKVCIYFLRGRCKKGDRCEYSHERRTKQKKEVREQLVPKRPPTLLEKLLESDIRREKSHLLQAFRFLVNNMFLLEYPEQPLKFFDWQNDIDGESGQRRTAPLDIDIDLLADCSHEIVDMGSGSPMDECEIQRVELAADSGMHTEDEDVSSLRETTQKE